VAPEASVGYDGYAGYVRYAGYVGYAGEDSFDLAFE
jgi:hypothetical protein